MTIHDSTDERHDRSVSSEVRDLLAWHSSHPLPLDAPIESLREQHRTVNRRYQIEPAEVAGVRDVPIAGTRAPAFLRIYEAPEVERTAVTILFFHGGSWMVGSVESHDALCRRICRATGARVLSAEYGLAPENPFPHQTGDCIAIHDWVCRHRDELGMGDDEIILCGDSSGANLVAVLTHDLKARKAVMPLAQILVYPSVGLYKHRTYPSWQDYGTGFLIGESSLARTLRYYLRSEDDLVDPRASPLLYEDFTGLPPALVMTADFDPIRDGGREYASRLVEAGVATTFVEYPGTTHGFLSYGVPHAQAGRALRDVGAFVRGVLRDAGGR